MDPFTWPSKRSSTSSTLHTATLWGYAQRTCRKRWIIARGGVIGSGISMLMERRQDDEMMILLSWNNFYYEYLWLKIFISNNYRKNRIFWDTERIILRTEGRKKWRKEISFKFQLILISHFRWEISPMLVIMSTRCFLWGILAETADNRRVIPDELWVWGSAIGGRVSLRGSKWTRGFPHLQQEWSRSFQSKWSLMNEKEFLFSADMSCLPGMHGFRFLSEVSKSCNTFGFILFYFSLFHTFHSL